MEDYYLAYALSSVKQEGLTLMAEQTQALKLLLEGRDSLTGPDYYYYLLKEGAALRTLVLVVVWPQGSEGFQVLKRLDARTTDNI